MKKAVKFIIFFILFLICIACAIACITCAVICVDSRPTVYIPESKIVNIYVDENVSPYPYRTNSDILETPDIPFTKAGYEIAGYQDTNGVKYNSYSKITNELSLYVIWKPIVYTLNFISTDIDGTNSIKQYRVQSGDVMPDVKPATEIQGYSFDGWFSSVNTDTKQGSGVRYADSSSWEEQYSVFSAEWYTANDKNIIKLYAGFKETKYKVTVFYQDSNYPNDTFWVKPNTDIKDLLNEKAIDTGSKKVVSWYANDNPSQPFNEKVINDNTEIYAVWKKYAVLKLVDADSLDSIIVYEGESVTLPTPSKHGWIFEGWYDNKSFSGNPITAPVSYSTASQSTFYAKWKDDPYLLT